MSALRQRLRRVGAWAPVIAASLACAAAPASASDSDSDSDEPTPPLIFDLQDPAGDAVGTVGIDLVAATVTQDREAGVFKAALTFASDPSTAQAYIHVALGFRRSGECITGEEQQGVAHLNSVATSPEAAFAISARTEVGGKATKVSSGTQVTITSDSDRLLEAATWSCTRVELLGIDNQGEPIPATVFDSVVAFIGTPPPTNPGQVAPAPQAGVITTFDTDRDAVPDSTDQCRDVPGAGTNGCPTSSERDSLRLVGAKRIEVDRLIARTGEKCPGAVKVTVTAKRRNVAKQQLGVMPRGAFCHVAGTVQLRRRATSVRVVVSGKGMKTLRVSVGSSTDSRGRRDR